MFRVLESGNTTDSGDGIALCQNNTTESLLGPGVLFISTEGMMIENSASVNISLLLDLFSVNLLQNV